MIPDGKRRKKESGLVNRGTPPGKRSMGEEFLKALPRQKEEKGKGGEQFLRELRRQGRGGKKRISLHPRRRKKKRGKTR